MIKSLQFSSSFSFRTIANQLKFSSNFIKSLHTEFNLPFSHHITPKKWSMLWAEKRLVSAKHSSSCKHFICSIATWINTWNSIGFTLKSDWRHLFCASSSSASPTPLSYAFAVVVERQLSVESIFHRFQFYPMEMCKGRAISSLLNPTTRDIFFKMLKLHFSIYSREHLNRFWCRKFLFQSDLIL